MSISPTPTTNRDLGWRWSPLSLDAGGVWPLSCCVGSERERKVCGGSSARSGFSLRNSCYCPLSTVQAATWSVCCTHSSLHNIQHTRVRAWLVGGGPTLSSYPWLGAYSFDVTCGCCCACVCVDRCVYGWGDVYVCVCIPLLHPHRREDSKPLLADAPLRGKDVSTGNVGVRDVSRCASGRTGLSPGSRLVSRLLTGGSLPFRSPRSLRGLARCWVRRLPGTASA